MRGLGPKCNNNSVNRTTAVVLRGRRGPCYSPVSEWEPPLDGGTMRRVIYWILAAVVAVGLTAGAGCSRRSPRAVFLIVIDNARADRLSAYGERMYRTPHIDSLAAGGVLFKRAVSTSTWSAPAMGSMLTSRYPTQLGLVEAPVGDEAAVEWNARREQTAHTLASGETTLAEILRGAGYSTAAFVN
ncbi:MAG TPA: hypothetical protein ENO14_03720, partial [Chromatiales bacterium]|nr:hypothetical protein [Chromatiales bacterium]